MCGNSDLMEPAGHGQACRDWLYHCSLGAWGRGDLWLGQSPGVETLLALGKLG